MADLFALPFEIREMIWEMCCLDPGLFFLPSPNFERLRETRDLVAALSPPRHSNTMWICSESRTVAQRVITRQAPEGQAAVPHRRYRPEIDTIVFGTPNRHDNFAVIIYEAMALVSLLAKAKAYAEVVHGNTVFERVAHIALFFYQAEIIKRYSGPRHLFAVFPRLQRISLYADPEMARDRSLTTWQLVPVAEHSDYSKLVQGLADSKSSEVTPEEARRWPFNVSVDLLEPAASAEQVASKQSKAEGPRQGEEAVREKNEGEAHKKVAEAAE